MEASPVAAKTRVGVSPAEDNLAAAVVERLEAAADHKDHNGAAEAAVVPAAVANSYARASNRGLAFCNFAETSFERRGYTVFRTND